MLGLGSSISAPTYLGASYADGFSIDLDGTNDYLINADFNKEVLKSGMSVGTWFKIDAASGTTFIAGCWQGASKAQTWAIRVTSASKINWIIRMSNDGNKYVESSAITDGAWHHAVGTFTKNGNVELFIDGSSVGTSATGADLELQVTDSQSDNSGTVQTGIGIGTRAPDNLGGYFNGHVNDVGIWTEALDADAVAAIYNSGTPTDLTVDDGNYDNSDTLVGYWKMEEGTGTTVADSSTNSIALTLTNGPTFSTDTP
jgi:hypothetical protein